MKLWRDRYQTERFVFEGREAVVVFPEKAEEKRRWALKTEYFTAFQDLEEKLAERGFHLLYLQNRNRWGTADDLAAKKRFADAVTRKYALREKGVLIGMSCGGLHAIKQAAAYAEMAALPNLETELLSRGWCLAWLANVNRWGTDADSDAKAAFVPFMAEEFGLEKRFACVGMSCGGLRAIKQAAAYPEMAALLYLDAPVVNLLSCPFGLGACPTAIGENAKKEALDALGLDMSGLIAYRDHPLDRIGEVIRHRIPALLVWGDADTIVPFAENGQAVLDAYRRTDIPFLAQSKPGGDHHPHGPAEMKEAVEFILAHA